MRTMIALAFAFALLGLGSAAEACNHVPAQALLQGGTCPVCGATSQSVQYQQQPLIQQPVMIQQPLIQYQQRVVQQVQQPIVYQQPVIQQAPVQFLQQQAVQYQYAQPVQAVQRLVVQQPYYQQQQFLQQPAQYLQMPSLLGGMNLQFQHRGLFGRQRSLSLQSSY